MIIIGPFIIIVNNHYGPAQEEPPEPGQPPERRVVPAPKSLPEKDTSNMFFIKCERQGCEWQGHYDTPGQAKQAFGAHKSYCDKGKLFKKHPFGSY